MKKISSVIIIMVFCAAFSNESSAQAFLNKLGKKLQDKVEQKIEDKAVDEVDKKMDEVLEGEEKDESDDGKSQSKEKQNERLQKMMKGLGMSGVPVPIEDAYQFDSKIKMHVESYDSKGKKESDGDILTYVNQGQQNFAYEFISGDLEKKGKGVFIMDFKNGAMIILSEEDGNKNGIVYGFKADMDELSQDVNKELDENAIQNYAMNPYVKSTGRSKTIAGYSCDEYEYDDPEEDTKANFWISKDANFKTKDYLSTIFKSASYSSGMPWGFIMESESLNKETGERSMMRVTELDNNANHRFTMGSYQITNLGSMSIPTGEE